MDRHTALQELATAHAVALRLHETGAADGFIAQALGIPIESLPGLLRIAESKLAALMGQEGPGTRPR